VLGLGLLVALALVGSRLARTESASRQPPAASLQRLKSAPTIATQLLVVDVAGAVRRPGLYRLANGARIADAVRRAGGATARADTGAINLAAPLVDGMQVVVPRVGGATGGSGAAATGADAAATGVRISLSSATVEQLDSLPGIGPVTAQKIVDWRMAHGAFQSVDALDEVPGIGPAKIEQLRDLVTP